MAKLELMIRASIQDHGVHDNNAREPQPNRAHYMLDLTDPVRRDECKKVIDNANTAMDEAKFTAVNVEAIAAAGANAITEGFETRLARLATAFFPIEWIVDKLSEPDGSETVLAMGRLVVASKQLCYRFHVIELLGENSSPDNSIFVTGRRYYEQ